MGSRFIVLEGLDGAGTTTQAELLHRVCPGSLLTREPTDGLVGRVARRAQRGEEGAPPLEALPWLYAADRADHLHRTVLPALEAGRTVISDRYAPSSLAYQALTHPLEVVWELNHRFRTPDIVIFLEVSVATAVERIRARGGPTDIFETEARLEAIRDAYTRVLPFLEDRGWPIHRLDGEAPPERVHAAIRERLP